MKYMLDTNIVIYIQKNKNPAIDRFHQIDPNEACFSSISLAELIYGIQNSVRKPESKVNLEKILKKIKVVDFDYDAATEYGEICHYLLKRGTPIGTMDMLIASHALSMDLIMVTNNVREFERVPGLKIENWAE